MLSQTEAAESWPEPTCGREHATPGVGPCILPPQHRPMHTDGRGNYWPGDEQEVRS